MKVQGEQDMITSTGIRMGPGERYNQEFLDRWKPVLRVLV